MLIFGTLFLLQNMFFKEVLNQNSKFLINGNVGHIGLEICLKMLNKLQQYALYHNSI